MKKVPALLIFSSLFPLFAHPAEPSGTAMSLKDTVSVERIVVTGTRAQATTNNLPMSVSVVTERQLDERREQSVLPLLVEQVPSLMITSRGVMGYGASSGAAGAMTIRGVGGGAGTLMLIDGHPQFMGIFSHPLADTYQTLMAERVEVVRGPASVLYGANAMGGVINIITRQREEDGTDVRFRAMYGSYNTVSTEFTNMVRSGGFNSVLSVGYNRSDGHRPNMDFEQYSGYAKLGYDFSRHWKTFVDLDLSKSYSSNPGRVDKPMLDNDMDILRGIASFSLQNDYERTSGALKVFYNFGDHFINDGYNPGGELPVSRFNSTDWMLGLSLFQNYSLFEGNQTTVGFDFQRYGGHSWNSYIDGSKPNNELANEYVNDFAGYINFQQRIWRWMGVNAGVRFDHHSVAGNQWIPQLGLNFHPAANTTLRAIVSKGYRNPTIRELYMFDNRNPDLQPESLMNYEISASQYLLDRRMLLELNLYYIDGRNSIVLVGQQPGQFMNTGKIDNAGIEFSADYRILPNLGINANYSYIHMKRDIIATPEHKFYAGADYSVRRWAFSTGVQYVGNLILEKSKESFVLWNARVTYKPVKWLDIFVRGENLLDQRYSMYDGYPMPGATVFGGISLKL